MRLSETLDWTRSRICFERGRRVEPDGGREEPARGGRPARPDGLVVALRLFFACDQRGPVFSVRFFDRAFVSILRAGQQTLAFRHAEES